MSETAIESHTDAGESGSNEHPSDWAYIKIALILGVITAIEVSTYFTSVVDWGDALIPSLLIMMVVKFYLVIMWFMHLKFDTPLFKTLFVGGLALAAVVYIATLLAFEFWG
jgi:cytochrome c oxidase subunit 4